MIRIRLRFQVMERPEHIESPHRGLDRRHAPWFAAAIGKYPVGVGPLELFPHQLPEAVCPLANLVLTVLRLPYPGTVHGYLITSDRPQISPLDMQPTIASEGTRGHCEELAAVPCCLQRASGAFQYFVERHSKG